VSRKTRNRAARCQGCTGTPVSSFNRNYTYDGYRVCVHGVFKMCPRFTGRPEVSSATHGLAPVGLRRRERALNRVDRRDLPLPSAEVKVLPPVVSRSLAGIALVLGAALFVPSLVVLAAALVQWSPIGLGYGLVYLFVLAIPAVPLLVLGAVVWRRAAHRPI
jgi:hypothetical protein